MKLRLAALALVCACAPNILILSLSKDAFAQTESTAVTTPAGSTHGSLVSGNVPCATSHNQLGDCSPPLPGSTVSTATNSQTLQNKSISGAQNTLTAIPYSALGAANATQSDANLSISSATRTVFIGTAFTVARTATLPAANSLPAGQSIRIVDYGGNLSAGGSDAILPAGSDTENGATASGCNGSALCQVMSAPGTIAVATTDGVSNWNVSLTLAQAEPLPPVSDSVIALPNMIGKTSGTVCIIGDSTATPGPSQTNNVDPSQIVWGFLTEKLKHDQPRITWSFQNFAIGGSNENQPLQTGTGSGLSLPSWFINPSNTWMSYVQAANCDVLFWMFGTNAANSGGGSNNGSNAATFIRQNFENINGWTKVPKIVVVTTKSANPATDSSGDTSNSEFHKAQAAFHRTFALSNANGYTSFPDVTNWGFGLVDLARYFTARMDGHDPAAQYFQTKPGCIQNGLALGVWTGVGQQTSTVCTTTHGDFRLAFTIPAGGGTTLFNYGGSNAIKINVSDFQANYVRLNIGGSGQIVPKYVLDGNTAGAPTISGSSVSTTNGNDVGVVVSVSNERVQVTICDGATCTLALDVDAPRFVSEAPGGTRINIGFASAPTGSPTINVTEFWEGIGYPTQAFSNYVWAMGTPGTCELNPTVSNCQGGNAQNHQRSNSAALDRQVINALRFSVTAAASTTNFGEVEVDGATVTSTAGVISAVQPAGANPAATAGPGTINGSASTFMRSDAAPAVQQGSSSQKGIVQIDGTSITSSSGVISANFAAPPAIGNTTAAAGSFTTLTNTGHVVSNGTALTSGNVAFGAGAGTGPTLNAIIGDDHKFNISFLTGSSPTPGGPVVTVTFASAYASAPNCIFAASGGVSANVISHVYVSSTTTTVVLTNANAAFAASATYVYNVQCIQ